MESNLVNIKDTWIYQSNKLIEASYSLTLLEQKLIRILASMIKKDDDDFKEYEFNAKDLSKLLNIDIKNIYRELDNITDKLMTRYIKIKDDENQKFKKRHLIDIADYDSGILKLRIHRDMKEFYLKLNWYTKYQLKNVLQFKSSYSFRFYELLKQYQKLKQRIIAIDDLRIILDIKKNQYPKYANLKQKVIKVAVDEINSKTDLQIEFQEIKTGRKVTAIKFLIHSNFSNDEVAATLDKDSNYTDKVKSIFKEHITNLEAKKLLNTAQGNISLIEEKYKLSKQCSNINNVVGWVISAIKQDYKKPQKIAVQCSFTDYEQRNYDFDELEKKLLGWDE